MGWTPLGLPHKKLGLTRKAIIAMSGWKSDEEPSSEHSDHIIEVGASTKKSKASPHIVVRTDFCSVDSLGLEPPYVTQFRDRYGHWPVAKLREAAPIPVRNKAFAYGGKGIYKMIHYGEDEIFTVIGVEPGKVESENILLKPSGKGSGVVVLTPQKFRNTFKIEYPSVDEPTDAIDPETGNEEKETISISPPDAEEGIRADLIDRRKRSLVTL